MGFWSGTIEDRDSNMGLFKGYYNVIRRTNFTINNIDSAPATTKADISLKNILKAEALGMRAFVITIFYSCFLQNMQLMLWDVHMSLK